MISRILIALILLVFGTENHAQNCGCTVSEVENNTVVPCTKIIGTIDTVYTTIELKTAISQANSQGGNMTILIADGVYPIATSSSYPYITASNMVFRSLSGNRDAVILTGTGMAAGTGVENGIYLVGNNITIANLTIQEVGNHGIAGQGDSLFVFNVKVQDTYEQMLKGTSGGDGADNGRVQCSLFKYTNNVGPNFYIGGLDIHQGDNWIVSDNVFINIASPSGSIAEHAIHFWNNSTNNIIERNVIVNCDRGIGFGLGSSPSEGGIIRNNMIYNDGTRPFNDVGISLESCPNTKIYNNTVFVDYSNAIEYRFSATTNVEIANNLTNKLIRSRNGGTGNVNSNYTTAQNSWFINPSIGDLRLSSNIPSVVDAGINISDVILDVDQIMRPQSLFDIGAHEYGMFAEVSPIDNSIAKLSLYPNPTFNSFRIQSDVNTLSNVVVYNALNQEVISFKSVNLSSLFEVDTSNWKSGLYICHVMGENTKPQLLKVYITK